MSYNLSKKSEFLPISKDDMKDRGWKELDIILITGDAYVDHPSYGTAIIGRVLEDAGFRVGVISQPDWKNIDDFSTLGKPRLFFGIAAGNLDSIIANHTTTRNKRKTDDYSPGGKPGLRPNRASIVYSNRVREAFPDTPIVLGGIEASLRRLAHYDHFDTILQETLKKKTGYQLKNLGAIFSKIYPENNKLLAIYFLCETIGGEMKAGEPFKELEWVNPEDLEKRFTTSFHKRLNFDCV